MWFLFPVGTQSFGDVHRNNRLDQGGIPLFKIMFLSVDLTLCGLWEGLCSGHAGHKRAIKT